MRIPARARLVSANRGKCIYCGEEKELSREHYLPERLGRSEKYETLDDRICSGCNHRLGQLNGGVISDFVTWKEKQIIEIKEGMTPNTWAHLIVARADENIVICRLQFFLGPNSKPWVFTVAVARNETKLVYDITSAHSFVYYEGGPKDGKVDFARGCISMQNQLVTFRQPA